MPAQLIALTEGPSLQLDKPILLVGRHPECDIQLESRKISRRHCCIAQVSDYLVVRDLGSTNGIRVNGVRILEGRLRAGDELTIGGLRFQVRWEQPANAGDRAQAREAARRQGAVADPGEPNSLDSFDDPVALSEANGQPRPPVASAAVVHPVQPLHPAHVKEPESPILPENLDLAPPSELFTKPSSHQSV